MDPHQQFCLKWNSYSSNLAITFSNLFKSDVLTDVTLACDGSLFKAHKLILAACSKKFADLFEKTPTNGQCVVILEATSSKHMAALLEFMYKGEVQVSQEALNDFLKSAENLQVKGLSTESGRLTAQKTQQQNEATTALETSTSNCHTPCNNNNNSTSNQNINNNINNINHNCNNGNINNIMSNLSNENISGSGVGGLLTGNGNNTSNRNCTLNADKNICSGNDGDGGDDGSGCSGVNGGGISGGGVISNTTYGNLGSRTTAVAAPASSLSGGSLGLSEHCSNMGGIMNTSQLVGTNLTNDPPGVAVVSQPPPSQPSTPINFNNNSHGVASQQIHTPVNNSIGNMKQECDSLMHSSNSTVCAMPTYVPPPIYRPISYEPLRKRALRSPYAEQEIRGSVLRDGTKSTIECPSPIRGPSYHRPLSSASSTTPTEPDTMQCERASPESSRFENHSPNINVASNNCHVVGSMGELLKAENKNSCPSHSNIDMDNNEHDDLDESKDASAEDLRVKLENSNYSPPILQTDNASPTAASTLLYGMKTSEGSLSGSLAASVAPADMLNVWNATKLNNKDYVEVMTPKGKKLKCLFCDRLYGYETNLRAHIRQRHQGIRVSCPYCSRKFTRNNTVRRHIAREHKHELALSAGTTIAPANLTARAAAAAAAAAAAVSGTVTHSK